MRRDWTFLAETDKRRVFLSPSGKYVLKVPLNERGEDENWWEHYRYNVLGWKDLYAKCRLVGKCLVMEFVKVATDLKNLPDWTRDIDCAQVGWNRKGKLVAYDYGN